MTLKTEQLACVAELHSYLAVPMNTGAILSNAMWSSHVHLWPLNSLSLSSLRLAVAPNQRACYPSVRRCIARGIIATRSMSVLTLFVTLLAFTMTSTVYAPPLPPPAPYPPLQAPTPCLPRSPHTLSVFWTNTGPKT